MFPTTAPVEQVRGTYPFGEVRGHQDRFAGRCPRLCFHSSPLDWAEKSGVYPGTGMRPATALVVVLLLVIIAGAGVIWWITRF